MPLVGLEPGPFDPESSALTTGPLTTTSLTTTSLFHHVTYLKFFNRQLKMLILFWWRNFKIRLHVLQLKKENLNLVLITK